jgi:hypothetical protein
MNEDALKEIRESPTMRSVELARKDNFLKNFIVKLHGKIFLFSLDGELKKFGFHID